MSGRGARDRPLTYHGEHDMALTYLPRQIVKVGTTAYLATAVSLGEDPATTPASWLPLGGGGGGADVPSTKQLAYVRDVALTAPFGTIAEVDWSGCTIIKGASYWGVPGSALDLDMVEDTGSLYYPAGEGIYDLQLTLTLDSGTLADVGKMVGIGLFPFGSNTTAHGSLGGYQPLRSIAGLAQAFMSFTWTDYIFSDNGALNAPVRALVDARNLSADIGADSIRLLILKR